jgi:hypothetical protein
VPIEEEDYISAFYNSIDKADGIKNFSEYDICSCVFTVIYNLIIFHDTFEQGEGTYCSILCATDCQPNNKGKDKAAP